MAQQVPVPTGLNLDDPKHFAMFTSGVVVSVVERQQGTAYTPAVPKGAPSAFTDEVLLSNGTTVHQCRLCAVVYVKSQSVNAHLGAHSPNRPRGEGSMKARRAAEANGTGVKALRRPLKETYMVQGSVTKTAVRAANTKRAVAFVPDAVSTPDAKTGAPKKYITKVTSKETGDAVRTVRSLREQLRHIAAAHDIVENQLLEFDRAVNDTSVDAEDMGRKITELKLERDELKEKLRTAELRAEENEADAHKYRTIKGMMS